MSTSTLVLSDDHCNIVEVYPNLWLGSLSAVRVVAGSQNSIPDVHWTVITLLNSSKLISITESMLKDRVAEGSCRHEVWKLADKPDAGFLSNRLKDVLGLIDDAVFNDETGGLFGHHANHNLSLHPKQKKTACLLHCAQGVSRSVSVAAAWYISRKQVSLQDALDLIRDARPGAMPNLGFIACLRALEQCHGEIDLAMKRMARASNGNESVGK